MLIQRGKSGWIALGSWVDSATWWLLGRLTGIRGDNSAHRFRAVFLRTRHVGADSRTGRLDHPNDGTTHRVPDSTRSTRSR